LRDVDLVGDHGAVQAFVEQQIGVLRQLLPWRERARLLTEGLRLLRVVQVFAPSAAPGLAVSAKQLGQFLEQVCFGTEMAEVVATQ
jgi:hypothetical protein